MSQRRLAAIMFTDIVGYTQMMGEDEEKGLSILRKNEDLQKPIIDKYHGKCLKEMGDGLLASFDTATDAVLCGKEIMDKSQGEADLSLRIGIHLGEVVFKENDVFGDGVNIASRLQAKASPGAIYFSEAVYRNIQNKKGLNATFVEEVKLKNVSFPVRIYELGSKQQQNKSITTKGPEKSIAVLPFVNMSGDPEQEYFCDGISEEIINTIVQYPDLKVSARTSSFSFKGKNDDLRVIGQKLGVSNVLEGSVRKSGDHVRVTAQLLEASTGFHLWSKKYDRKLENIFAIQDEIAMEIADQLMTTLSNKEEVLKVRNHTHDLEAYQLYFKGRSLYYQRGPTIMEGLECFKQAIDIDPNYALAYSGLADAYIMLSLWGYVSPEECWNAAIPASEKAIQLDPDLSETCHTRGIIALLYERDYKLAQTQFKKAIKLNPTNTQARVWYGLFYLLYLHNDQDSGLNQCEIAALNDPLSGYAHNSIAFACLYTNHMKRAEEESKIASKLEPDSLYTHSVIAQIKMINGEMEEALKEAKICNKMSSKGPLFLLFIIYIYQNTGNPDLAQESFHRIEQILENGNITPVYASIAAAFLGNTEYALQLLKNAADTRDTTYPLGISLVNRIQTISQLPGFVDVIKNSGVPLNQAWLDKD